MSKKTAPLEAIERAPLAYENTAFLNSPDGRLMRIMAEYVEPLARFRHERIQDTVVFYGSARFTALDVAHHQLQLLAKPSSMQPAPPEEQPATEPELEQGTASELQRKHAEAAVEMAHYYEDARRLAYMLTEWSRTLKSRRHRFVVTSGGGPGIMEAANRGAYEAGGKTIGLNISLPFEQMPNPYITPSLNFNFHYFFMRKYWFAYLAKALVVFPGGYGTMDEAFEILTLIQTEKLAKKMTVVLYGSSYWNSAVDLDFLVEKGTISPSDRELFQFADTPQQAFNLLRAGLITNHLEPESRHGVQVPAEDESCIGPEIARTRSSPQNGKRRG